MAMTVRIRSSRADGAAYNSGRCGDESLSSRQARAMAMAHRVGLAFAGMLLGAAAGAGAGLLGGLGYTALADTSGFEGYAGFVVGFWMLGGIAAGVILGLIAAYRISRRRNL